MNFYQATPHHIPEGSAVISLFRWNTKSNITGGQLSEIESKKLNDF
jgi:hypothetical protein